MKMIFLSDLIFLKHIDFAGKVIQVRIHNDSCFMFEKKTTD